MINISVIGGGGGGSSTLNCLKYLFIKKKINSLTGLIATSDNGGSTGVLKKQYKTSAWGDIGKNLIALADENKSEINLLKKCLHYRFETGTLKGHTMRNILMTAFDLLPNCDEKCTIKELSKILDIDEKLRIVPITENPTELVLKFTNGKTINGQYKISNYPIQSENKEHTLKLLPNDTKINKLGIEYLTQSNFVIIAPGHFYGTTLSTLIVPGLDKILKNKKIIIIMPFFNRNSLKQTTGWKTSNYLKEYTKYLKREPDYIICNNNYKPKIPKHSWIVDDMPETTATWISQNLVPTQKKKNINQKADKIIRSPINYNSTLMRNILLKIFNT